MEYHDLFIRQQVEFIHTVCVFECVWINHTHAAGVFKYLSVILSSSITTSKMYDLQCVKTVLSATYTHTSIYICVLIISGITRDICAIYVQMFEIKL